MQAPKRTFNSQKFWANVKTLTGNLFWGKLILKHELIVGKSEKLYREWLGIVEECKKFVK